MVDIGSEELQSCACSAFFAGKPPTGGIPAMLSIAVGSWVGLAILVDCSPVAIVEAGKDDCLLFSESSTLVVGDPTVLPV